MNRFAFIVFCSVMAASPVAQQPAAPAFDVTSVKPSPNDLTPEGTSTSPDGSVRFTRFQVRTLITIAYRSEGIQRFDQLIGGPTWLSVDRFDIAAKPGAGSDTEIGPGALPTMLRSLLRDRFQLRVHTETRELPAYALVLARRDGKPGPQLRESTVECPTGPATDAEPDRWCGIRTSAGGVITARAASTGLLAGNLSGKAEVDRFVTDRTGLTGRYDFRLEYSPPFQQSSDAPAAAGPSLFTALIEQLGLRLQPETIAGPVLVIDSVERPTPD
jgi:uncharacterized protein (TIGR03435 family)